MSNVAPLTANINEPHLIAFYADRSGLTVTCRVIRGSDADTTDVQLTEAASASTERSRVYTGAFVPSRPGWYFLHYEASGPDLAVQSVVGRLYASDPTEMLSGNPVSAQPSGVASGDRIIEAQTVVSNQVGTIKFTVGRR
jgi:hypothetical protein